MKLRRSKPAGPNEELAATREDSLVDAEKRANVLFARAEWLYTIVMKRDEANHWQAAVDELFLGGKT